MPFNIFLIFLFLKGGKRNFRKTSESHNSRQKNENYSFFCCCFKAIHTNIHTMGREVSNHGSLFFRERPFPGSLPAPTRRSFNPPMPSQRQDMLLIQSNNNNKTKNDQSASWALAGIDSLGEAGKVNPGMGAKLQVKEAACFFFLLLSLSILKQEWILSLLFFYCSSSPKSWRTLEKSKSSPVPRR